MIRLYHPLSKFNDRKFLQALGVLDEANVGGVLTEAATAQVEAVLANDTVGVAAHAAATAQHGTEVSTTRRMALHPLDHTAQLCVPQPWSLQRCTRSSRATHTPADLAPLPLGCAAWPQHAGATSSGMLPQQCSI